MKPIVTLSLVVVIMAAVWPVMDCKLFYSDQDPFKGRVEPWIAGELCIMRTRLMATLSPLPDTMPD